MVNPRTMKQKAGVMVLTLIGAIILGLAVGLLPFEEHSANAAPKEGKGGKPEKAGKVAATANVDYFEINCDFFIIWTQWENMPMNKVAKVDIVIIKDRNTKEERRYVIPSDSGHPISNGTALFTPEASSRLGPFGTSTYEVTETRFYDKRDKTIKTFYTGGDPLLTGKTSKIADCD